MDGGSLLQPVTPPEFAAAEREAPGIPAAERPAQRAGLLSGVYLEKAELVYSHLDRAFLSGAIGLSIEQIMSAASYEGALLPDNLRESPPG